MDDVIDALIKATKPPMFREHSHVPHLMRDIDLRRFSVSCQAATLLESVNEIVRAQGAASWELGYWERPVLYVSSLQPQPEGGSTFFDLAYSQRRR